MSLNVLLLLILAVSAIFSFVTPQKPETINLFENELILRVDEEFLVLQVHGNVFYPPFLAKINVSTMQGNRSCYFNPFWNQTVLPVVVDLWSQSHMNRLEKMLAERKAAICNNSHQLSPDNQLNSLLNATLCTRNASVSPPPVGLVYLESDWARFVSLPVDFTHRRYPPTRVTFGVAVPFISNCTQLQLLFNETSFLSTMYLGVDRNELLRPERTVADESGDESPEILKIWLTNSDIIDAGGLITNDSGTPLNMTSVKYVREDLVSILSTRLSIKVLRNVSVNYANAETVQERVYEFLCRRKVSVEEMMNKLAPTKGEAYPDGTITLLAGLRGLRYCRVPTIEWTTSYSLSQQQIYHPNHGYYYPIIETTNIKNYLQISLQRMSAPRKVRLPLTAW